MKQIERFKERTARTSTPRGERVCFQGTPLSARPSPRMGGGDGKEGTAKDYEEDEGGWLGRSKRRELKANKLIECHRLFNEKTFLSLFRRFRKWEKWEVAVKSQPGRVSLLEPLSVPLATCMCPRPLNHALPYKTTDNTSLYFSLRPS